MKVNKVTIFIWFRRVRKRK